RLLGRVQMEANERAIPEETMSDPDCIKYLDLLDVVAKEDVEGLKRAQKSYGNSWKERGGVGAFFNFCRKWDRLENRLAKPAVLKRTVSASNEPDDSKTWAPSTVTIPIMPWDIFGHALSDTRAEGIIDDIRDLRRYLLLVE